MPGPAAAGPAPKARQDRSGLAAKAARRRCRPVRTAGMAAGRHGVTPGDRVALPASFLSSASSRNACLYDRVAGHRGWRRCRPPIPPAAISPPCRQLSHPHSRRGCGEGEGPRPAVPFPSLRSGGCRWHGRPVLGPGRAPAGCGAPAFSRDTGSLPGFGPTNRKHVVQSPRCRPTRFTNIFPQ